MADQVTANPGLLMSVEELHDRLGDDNLCIVDARASHLFAAGHIPGAVHLDLYGISLNNTSDEAFDAFMWMFQYLLGSRGIGSDKTVVWYEDNSGMRAARGFWVCEYFDHNDVHMLDGGLDAWQAAGYDVTTDCVVPEVAPLTGDPIAERHVGADILHGMLERDDVISLDTRSDGEYYGTAVRAARGGAIPGAVHVEYVNNLAEDGTFKSIDELRAMYDALGVTPEKEIVPY
ncbi:MAG: sulfurtransferase [Candidatus Latescibacteria bacterium]|jgi:thiosulfate/3-mercaptopyruvate sulfurtransferase|nr:sulfurtransferase [Candidatus Latescibacterota bacterium]MBT4137487.1 sulfurtransferase [Candidatus Latescibacterota bacterium]